MHLFLMGCSKNFKNSNKFWYSATILSDSNFYFIGK